MERSKRKEMECQLRRSEILHQAERILVDKGFYKTTMAETADASGFAIDKIERRQDPIFILWKTMPLFAICLLAARVGRIIS